MQDTMQLRDDLVLRQVGKDYIIVDPGQEMVDMSKVFSLNETAAWLWETLQGAEFSYMTLTELLLNRYEVTLEEAQKDAHALIEVFTKNGLLK